MRRRQQRGGSAAFAVLLALMLVCAAAFADEFKPRDWGTGRWSFADTARAAVYCGLRYVDAAQSATVARNPDKWKEAGGFAVLIYGEHPTVNEVYKFNLGACGVMTFISYQIDAPTRAWWQWGIIGAEAYTVNENRKLGIEADWPLFGAAFRW